MLKNFISIVVVPPIAKKGKNWNILGFLLSCKSIKYCEFMRHKLVFFLLFAFWAKKKLNILLFFFILVAQWKASKWKWTRSKYKTKGRPIEARGCAVRFWIKCDCISLGLRLCRSQWLISFFRLGVFCFCFAIRTVGVVRMQFSIAIRYANCSKQRESWMLVQWTKFTIIVSFLR